MIGTGGSVEYWLTSVGTNQHQNDSNYKRVCSSGKHSIILEKDVGGTLQCIYYYDPHLRRDVCELNRQCNSS